MQQGRKLDVFDSRMGEMHGLKIVRLPNGSIFLLFGFLELLTGIKHLSAVQHSQEKIMSNQPIALVTGGSRGIGASIAARLANDGYHVILHYGSSADTAREVLANIEASGGSGELVQADLSRTEDISQLVATVIETLDGRKLDVLVNNAGVAEFVPFKDTDAATIDRQYAINVRAPFLLTSSLLAVLADDARIVFTSSIVAQTHFDAIPAYAITKGAIDTLVRHLAVTLGERGIRVNAVAPGAIDTDMSTWLRSEEGVQTAHSIQALKRVGQPDDIAGTVAFLAGSDSRWVTGQVIDTSGGTKL